VIHSQPTEKDSHHAHDRPNTLKHDSGPMDQAGKRRSFFSTRVLSTAIAANGKRQAIVPVPAGPLAPDLLDKMNRYWRAANYLVHRPDLSL
jgi:hypothetical protein